ncbi:hypothetical protein LSTR_LSTR007309 [Laodelphax striatellus]|uniref:Uncharacterized protein n=1 Tax=Laodelphax striatellus TaxID=195883 RepID=A0A482WTI9_LAOST|nr:hypothetical protein LSTR_LSTR007309 [Laodelphax striatellus]
MLQISFVQFFRYLDSRIMGIRTVLFILLIICALMSLCASRYVPVDQEQEHYMKEPRAYVLHDMSLLTRNWTMTNRNII